jgi:hypothetical protein
MDNTCGTEQVVGEEDLSFGINLQEDGAYLEHNGEQDTSIQVEAKVCSSVLLDLKLELLGTMPTGVRIDIKHLRVSKHKQLQQQKHPEILLPQPN